MSIYRCQCQLLLITSASAREVLEDELSSGSRSISLRKTRSGSSSRRVEMSTLSDIQSGLPLRLLLVPGTAEEIFDSSRFILSFISSSRRLVRLPPAVRATSALIPTRASLPSVRDTWAEPLQVGRRSVSARRGRKSVGERKSGRRDGVWEREVWRYDSSAGERLVDVEVAGMMLEEQW